MAPTITAPAADARVVPRSSKRLLSLRGDDHLVTRLRRGDEVAFEVLFERHLPGILSFCRHMLGSPEEAEDAVQQVFASAHRDLLRDARDIRLKPWLYAIARNRCLSMLRVRKEQPDDELDGITAGLHEEVEQRADLRELVSDLQDLPEDQRAALILSELRDLSHAEIAEALDCGVANVKGLVFRARSGLIERREARGVACEEIQQELATARGGALRRGKLRHHLHACSACTSYLEQIRRQRKMMALVLPVVPSAGLKKSVLATVGLGGGAGGGGGAAAGGALVAATTPVTGATLAKVAVVGVLIGGSGLAGEAVIEHQQHGASDSAGALSSSSSSSSSSQRSREPGAAGGDLRPARERRSGPGSEPAPRSSEPNGRRQSAGDAPSHTPARKQAGPPATAAPSPLPPAVAPVVAPQSPGRSKPKEERVGGRPDVFTPVPTPGQGRPLVLPNGKTTRPVIPQRPDPVVETAPAPPQKGRGKTKDKSDPDG